MHLLIGISHKRSAWTSKGENETPRLSRPVQYPLQLHTLYSCYAVRQIWRYTGASRFYILLDCTLEFCRAIEAPYRSSRSNKGRRVIAAALVIGKRNQFLMWMARFWTFRAHSRTDSETVG